MASSIPINLRTALVAVFLCIGIEFLEFLGPEMFTKDIARQSLAVANRREQVLRTAQAVFVSDAFEFGLVGEELFSRNAKLLRFFLEQFSADLDRLFTLLL
jgi:hypothetical protein